MYDKNGLSISILLSTLTNKQSVSIFLFNSFKLSYVFNKLLKKDKTIKIKIILTFRFIYITNIYYSLFILYIPIWRAIFIPFAIIFDKSWTSISISFGVTIRL